MIEKVWAQLFKAGLKWYYDQIFTPNLHILKT